MALIKCPDCGHAVSPLANCCPSCGRPNQVPGGASVRDRPLAIPPTQSLQEKSAREGKRLKIFSGSAMCIGIPMAMTGNAIAGPIGAVLLLLGFFGFVVGRFVE